MRTELDEAVDAYFRTTGLSRHGGASMLLKSATLFSWAITSYALLVFWAPTWWTAIPLAVSLALAMAGIGFAVMHDGGHASYSDRRAINRWAARSLDLIGGSSFVWAYKHNVLHHTYTNVDGADDDIDFEPFMRLSPGQTRRWFHRFQWLYWPALLVFLPPKWTLVDDFVAVARGQVGGHPLPRLSRRDWVVLIAGKLCFALWAIVIPLLVVGPAAYLAGAALVSCALGVTLGVVFQLAHAVTCTSFFQPDASGRTPLPWAEHQLATTADFARSNPLLTWFVGGLNHQVEHHLFPRIGHRHYPALAEVVRQVCARHGIRPHDHPTLGGALFAHVRHLYRLGRPTPEAAGRPSSPQLIFDCAPNPGA
ncbi:MAG TPA: acyl-CoA desaturase [Planctomycetes bacterium]|nr:acyl-CoA desaturase [Planctomycetota bacterium]